MPEAHTRKPIDDWFGEKIAPGEFRDVMLVVGESYSGMNVQIPIHIRRAEEDGPVVFVSAAIHEINGAGGIRQLIQDTELRLSRGAHSHPRPQSARLRAPIISARPRGPEPLASPARPAAVNGRLATIFSTKLSVGPTTASTCTTAVRRTSYPNVRGDHDNRAVRWRGPTLAAGIINKKGPSGVPPGSLSGWLPDVQWREV